MEAPAPDVLDTPPTTDPHAAPGYANPGQRIALQAASHLPLQSSGRDLTAQQRDIVWAAFRNNAGLRNWPDDVLDALVGAGHLRTYPDGTLIYGAGEACPDIHVILSGVLEWEWSSPEGGRAVEDFIPPGEVANFIAVLTGETSVHNQRARGLTRLFHIPAHALHTQLARDPTLTATLLRLIAGRARGLHDRLGRHSLTPFRARLAYQLLALAKRYGVPETAETHGAAGGIALSLRLSQEDLAALLMASRQYLNREFRWFLDRHIVRIRYGRITLLDLAQLRAISEGVDEGHSGSGEA
ncbi:CRP-like cAMP-activated global transcriptional regulator [Pandoraea iniqua]|uniref:Crp/Fnr family transcriptional regulator n=1 Tax=Pandoraea iniqua TaxID=2508288 RepID=UPI001240121C|nr:Crp/Fnr family transcriptional regulator [Pandoraea iniqua]VVE04944.1 CRP-like cAMP-activated global transcriptional regulator [Pandoraea iniqua]